MLQKTDHKTAKNGGVFLIVQGTRYRSQRGLHRAGQPWTFNLGSSIRRYTNCRNQYKSERRPSNNLGSSEWGLVPGERVRDTGGVGTSTRSPLNHNDEKQDPGIRRGKITLVEQGQITMNEEDRLGQKPHILSPLIPYGNSGVGEEDRGTYPQNNS